MLLQLVFTAALITAAVIEVMSLTTRYILNYVGEPRHDINGLAAAFVACVVGPCMYFSQFGYAGTTTAWFFVPLAIVGIVVGGYDLPTPGRWIFGKLAKIARRLGREIIASTFR